MSSEKELAGNQLQTQKSDFNVDELLNKVKADPPDKASINQLTDYFNSRKDYHSVKELYISLTDSFPNDVSYRLQLASARFQLEEYEKAIADFEKIISLDPTYHNSRLKIGLCYEKMGNVEKAIANYQRAMVANSQDYQAYDHITRLYKKEKKWQEIVDLCNTEEASGSEDHLVYFDRGFAEIDLKLYNKAIIDFEKAIDLNPHEYNAYYNIGVCYERLEETEKAISYYDKTLSLDAGNGPALGALTKIYKSQQNWKLIADMYRKCIEAGNATTENYFELAYAENELKNYELAVDNYNEVSEDAEYKDRHLAYNNKAVALEKLNRDSDAIESYSLAIQQKPDFTLAYYNRGLLHKKNNNPADGISDMRQCISIDPNYTNALNLLWNHFYDAQNCAELEKIFTDLAQRQTTPQSETYFRLALAQQNLQKYDEALANYNKAYELKYPHPECLFNKAVLFTDIDKYDDAIASYKQLIIEHPDYEQGYYSYAYLLQEKRRYADAVELIQELTPKNTNEARKQYELGNVYLDSLSYYKALKAYDETLKINPKYVYAAHNKAWVYEKLGDFQTARKQWKKTVELYEQIGNDPAEEDRGLKFFYHGEILFYSLQSSDYDTIENLFIKATEFAPNYALPYLSRMRLYQLRKQQMRDNGNEDSFHTLQNEYHMKMLDAYRTGKEIVKKEIEKKPTRFNLSDLGEFYLAMEMYDEAAEQFKKSLEKNENFVRGYTGLGVAQVRLEMYKEAIGNFKKAAQLDPDDLNIQSNLGDAYRKAEIYEMAEITFQKILKNTPFYIDAIIGLGECYKTLGDKAMEEKDGNVAEEYFSKAKDLFNKALTLSKTDDKVSKRINDAEKSALHYSLGYTRVRLFEMKKGLDLLLLQSAEKDFKSIQPQQAEYFKAQKAIKKIKQRIYSSFSAKKAAPAFIFIMAVLVFLITQYFFYFDRYQQKNQYSLNKKELAAFLKTTPLDSIGPKLESWSGDNFSTVEEFQDRLQDVIPENYLAKVPASIMNTQRVDVRENISELSYGFFTFGSMIFMVVGLFLRDITRLKLGSIEMDKNAVDNVSTSTSLGVMK